MFTATSTLRLSETDIVAFLSSLAVVRHVSASTQNQALSSLLFLYDAVLHGPVSSLQCVVRAAIPARLPVVLSRDEVRRVLDALSATPKLVAMLLYGAGLRLSEALELRVKDIDMDRAQVVVRQAMGRKDRRTMGAQSRWPRRPESRRPAVGTHSSKTRRHLRAALIILYGQADTVGMNHADVSVIGSPAQAPSPNSRLKT